MTIPAQIEPSPAAALRPSRDDVVDGAALLALGVLALVGFRTTYTGSEYLIVGVVGLLLGVLTAHIANALRQPLVVLAAMGLAVFFVLGAALVVRSESVAGVLPTPASSQSLAQAGVDGWKDLLTTQPPVGSGGTLLVVPYILGLLGGLIGYAAARRTRVPIAPVFAPFAMLVAVILLGTTEPAATLLQGAVFAVGALCWIALRGRRLRVRLGRDGGRRSRILVAVGLLGLTGVIAALVAPALEPSSDRIVLRQYVDPPVDITEYPSPLAGFRMFRNADALRNRPLLEVRGLPKGSYVRLATLDSYNGSVWGATNDGSRAAPDLPKNEFLRIGVGSSGSQGSQDDRSAVVTVKVLRDYAERTELNAWLPTTAEPRTVRFRGADAEAHQAALVVNQATGQGLVVDRLNPGDRYTVSASVGSGDRADGTSALEGDAQPFGAPTLPTDASQFTEAKATVWSAGAASPAARLSAVADKLRREGAYSDGEKAEAYFLAGHSVGRLSREFLNEDQPTGNDEQYAAAYALMANQLGVPARVVVGAQPGQNGLVRGSDIHAWVEVHFVDGWASIPSSYFMNARHRPTPQTESRNQQNQLTQPVPPPSPVRPRSTVDDGTVAGGLAQATRRNLSSGGWELPWIVGATVRVIGPPLLLAAAIIGLILGIKAQRRNRRRRTGPATTRVAAGWTELIDCARDFGAEVPLGGTRSDEAAAMPPNCAGLATAADATVFGPGDPTDDDVERYWSRVDEARAAMNEGTTRWTRIRAALSLRSLRPRTRGHLTGAAT